MDQNAGKKREIKGQRQNKYSSKGQGQDAHDKLIADRSASLQCYGWKTHAVSLTAVLWLEKHTVLVIYSQIRVTEQGNRSSQTAVHAVVWVEKVFRAVYFL